MAALCEAAQSPSPETLRLSQQKHPPRGTGPLTIKASTAMRRPTVADKTPPPPSTTSSQAHGEKLKLIRARKMEKMINTPSQDPPVYTFRPKVIS